jgi:hypothetical protein
MSMPKRLDPGAKQGIMTKTHRQTLDGKKHPSFATQSPPKADIAQRRAHVRLVPLPDQVHRSKNRVIRLRGRLRPNCNV